MVILPFQDLNDILWLFYLSKILMILRLLCSTIILCELLSSCLYFFNLTRNSNWPFQDQRTGKKRKTQAVVLGLGSLFNHNSSYRQNVGWKRNLKSQSIIYTALRDINAGEELCISYGAHVWFEVKGEDEDSQRERVTRGMLLAGLNGTNISTLQLLHRITRQLDRSG